MDKNKYKTKSTLANCMHLDSGWCVDCIEQFCDDFQKRVEKAINPRAFELEALELEAIGELLSYIIAWEHKKEHNNLFLQGNLGIYSEWGHKLGVISDHDKDTTFRFYPSICFSQAGNPCSNSND